MALTVVDVVLAGFLTGGIYCLAAAGFNLQYGVARILNVAHGEFIMLGAIGTWALYVFFGINPFVSLVICGPILFGIAILIHMLVFPRLRRLSETTEAFEGNSLLAAFGVLFIIQNIAVLIWGADERGYTFLATPINIFGAVFAANRLVALLFAVILTVVLYIFITRTRTGKAIRAVTQDATGARLMGIPTGRMETLCFGLGALLAGFAGVLLSSLFTITPFMGLQYTIIAIIVVVLGGLGNILGSMAGGFILGIIGSIATYVHVGSAMIVYYAIFVALILARPRGLFARR